MAREDRNVNIFPSTEEEAARLRHWDGFLQKALGGLADFAGHGRMLDLLCGPGSWALDVGLAYPEQQVLGIDSDPLMVKIAREQALVAGKDSSPLANVSFRHMPIVPPLPFAAGSFDFIHARRWASFLARESWQGLLEECLRLLRPGGQFGSTEAELPSTSSPACERFSEMIAEAYRRAGKNLSDGAREIGVSSALPRLVRQAGFQRVDARRISLDFSADASLHAGVRQHEMVTLRLIQPFLLAWGVSTGEELERLYEQARRELHEETFNGSFVLVLIQGEKAVL